MWNNLDEFAEWYKSNNHPFKPPTTDPIYKTAFNQSSVIFREGRYQVELYFMKPNWVSTDTTAPGLENRIMFLNGTIKTDVGGEIVSDTESFEDMPSENGLHPLYNTVFKGDTKGTSNIHFGAKGACLLLLQKWDDGIPMTSMSVQRGMTI
jgi:hypothetical protein